MGEKIMKNVGAKILYWYLGLGISLEFRVKAGIEVFVFFWESI